MLTDDQIIDEIRCALAAETDGINPQPGLLGRVYTELAATRARGRWVRRLTFRADAIFTALAAGVAIGIAVVALVVLHHSNTPTQAPATSSVPAGTVGLAARAPDPSGGLAWGLRTIQTGPFRACLQIGRLQSGQVGVLGQDGAFGNDGRFHPIPIKTSFPCARTDASSHLFLNVFEVQIPASAALGATSGCQPAVPGGISGLPKSARRHPTCAARDLRNIAFGALGPEAVSVTYSANHHSVTERTGPDGAYLVVMPATQQACTFSPQGKRCFGGGGELTTSTLQSGLVTAVTYRNGHVCHLSTATSAAAASCPNIGYAHYPPFHPPHITEAQVTAPMTVRMFTAKHYCYKPLAFGSFMIACDHDIPHGYKPANRLESPAIALVDISFTAPLAADNHHSVYEFSYGRQSGPANCRLNTGGTAATTMLPIRAGQRVTIQDDQEVCPGTYAGLVTYQPDGDPGRDTLSWPSPIRDHSVLVGRFKYFLQTKPNRQ